MTNNYLLLFALLVFLYSFPASAQEKANLHFKKINVDAGLSETSVYCILQDRKGFMWFGTKDGLNRYDGAGFRTFRNSSFNTRSIGNNFIRSIAEGGSNTLYIGTDAGIYVMNTIDETFSKLTTTKENGIEISSAVNTLCIDKGGRVWIGTMHEGIFIYDPQLNSVKAVKLNNQGIVPSSVWSIISDKSGTIWAGTRRGLLRYNASKGQMEAVQGMFSEIDNSSREILSIMDDSKGNLWLGTWDGGIKLFNKQSNSSISYYGMDSRSLYITHVRSIFQYTPQSLLIGSDDGLYLFFPERDTIERIDSRLAHSVSDQNVYSIARDREGGIWIGTYFGGVNYLNTALMDMEAYYPDRGPGVLSGKAISQFCEDTHGNMWIATEDAGVHYFDTKTRTFSRPVKTSYHNTHALLLDGEDLWIGTFSRGIDLYNTRTRSVMNLRSSAKNPNTLNDDCIFSLYRTKNGDIYAGTPVGLNKYNRHNRTFSRVPEATGFIYDMKEDDYGNFWVATYGLGAKKLDAKTKTWVHYDTVQNRNNPMVGSKLTGIYIDNQKRVIFPSEGRGIFIYDYETDNFKNISETDGLPNNVIYGVLDDPYGNLWLSSNKGLICFNTNNPRQFKLYTKTDGLQSNQFNFKSSHKTAEGKFYFGGINGFNSFYPQNLTQRKNGIVPPVEITQIRLLGKSDAELEQQIQLNVNKRQRIELPYNRASFAISYVSLSYVSQKKNQYAYMLEGADNNWNYAGNNKSVSYVNLAPGKYIFKVKASNNDGLWNETGAGIEIEILPPIWLSIPAKALYAIVTLALFYLLVSYYLKRHRNRQQLQLETFKAEQETLAFKSKIGFFSTIAHEIRTPLSLIKAPLEEVMLSGEGSPQTNQNLSIIERNCNRLTVLVDQLLDFRKMDSTRYVITPEVINLKQFINEQFDQFRKSASTKKIAFELRDSLSESACIISDSDALTKIVGNLLTNAIKFTSDKVILEAFMNTDRSYTLLVHDNGRGIPDTQKDLIFDPFYQVYEDDQKIGTGIGLSLVKHLTEVLNGELKVSDATPRGTIFAFTCSDITGSELIVQENDLEIQEVDEGLALHGSKKEMPADRRDNILVIDDNPEMIQFIKGCIQHDYSVDTALNANEALSLLELKNYDLIISDIRMPGTDGIALTKKLKADLNYSHIPLILLSAHTENMSKIEGLRSGADVFIEKPFSTSFLKAQIASLLENRKAILEAFNRAPMASYSSLVHNKSDEDFLSRLNDEIEKHISDENFTVESLASLFNISRSNLQRKLKSMSGSSPGDYLRTYRLKKACKLLLETDLRVNEVAFYVGFNSASYFSKAFFKCYGMTPTEFASKRVSN